VHISEFIELPNLSEYFLELFPMVSVSQSGERTVMKINGPQPEMDQFEPLVMIDGVALLDHAALLRLRPTDISKIEIVESPWIRGNFIFGGIISITSRNNDFAGVELPASGLFFPYRFFAPATVYPEEFLPTDRHIPDTRNTLYWNPSLIIPPGSSQHIEFKAPDRPGSYTLLIRKIESNGDICANSWPIQVE
jgi:hypothetical protein